ncbi:hypothetical protein ACLB1T_28760 [Escherichia coli]
MAQTGDSAKAGVNGKMASVPFLDRVVEQLLVMRQQRKKHLLCHRENK